MAQINPNLTGKYILVTGATDGIGKETALQLAQRGAIVLVHARNADRGEGAIRELLQYAPDAHFELVTADLSSLAQVRQFAQSVNDKYEQLDVLVNNAAVFTRQRQESVDGYELAFAVNYLAHFLLTHLLLDLIKYSAPARIVNVASNVHRSSSIHFDDLQLTHGWNGHEAYGQSKVANILFTYALARRLTGTGVTANALHPGVIDTKLLRESWMSSSLNVTQGAMTSVYLASDPSVAKTTGEYFDNLRAVKSSPQTYDRDMQERLWDVSLKLSGLG
jgi:NAD(P)-dependent dehydrogenase (short-subunit alcohol dehydrogenase family)